jgi:uncharacterized protein HemX
MQKDGGNSEIGTIAGIIIVILVLVIGAVYFFKQRIEKQQQIEKTIQQVQTAEASSSDEIQAIQRDAATVDTKDLGSGIDQLK